MGFLEEASRPCSSPVTIGSCVPPFPAASWAPTLHLSRFWVLLHHELPTPAGH